MQALLREECEGRGRLTPETILAICDILAGRDPSLPTAHQLLQTLCRSYL